MTYRSQEHDHQQPPTYYSTIIVGAGVSGLSMAYYLCKRGKDPRTILILDESSKRLGGRVHTEHNVVDGTIIEYGAGRINGNHPYTLEFIDEIGLGDLLVPIPYHPDSYYIREIQNSNILTETQIRDILNVVHLPRNESLKTLWNHLYAQYLEYEKIHENDSAPIKGSVYDYLYDLTQTHPDILTAEELLWIRYTFFYDVKLYRQNIQVAFHIIMRDLMHNSYYILRGGLDQIIHRVVDLLQEKGVTIHMGQRIIGTDTSIHNGQNHIVYVEDVKNNNISTYSCTNLYMGIPPNRLSYIDGFRQDNRLWSSLEEVPIMRVYMRFPKLPDGSNWFDRIGRVITDASIRFFTPIDKENGVCMVSYVQGYNATNLKKYSKRIKAYVMDRLRNIFSPLDIPDPTWTKHKWWDVGTHIWNKNADIRKVLDSILEKYVSRSIYFIGEAWSHQHGWMHIENGEVFTYQFGPWTSTKNHSVF